MTTLHQKLLNKTKFFLLNLIVIGLTIGVEGFLTAKTLAQVQTNEPIQTLLTVQSIEILGNTVLTDSELEGLLNSYLGQNISLQLLQRIEREIQTYYLERGYLSSGSFLPTQELQEGIIQIEIIEGTLEDIQFEGLSSLSENYLKSRLPQLGKPLNLYHLLESLNRLENEPLIAKLHGEINRKSEGKNVLLLTIEENSPLKVEVIGTNAYSPAVGPLGGIIKVTHLNFFGFGDRLTVNGSKTEGLTRFGLSYSLPVNKFGRLTFSYNNADNKLIEEPIEPLGIEADYSSVQVSFEQPIIWTSTESLTLGLALEHINSETFVLNRAISFPFTEGLDDGQSKITTLRLTQEYTKKGKNTFLAFNSQFNIGIDAFDATKTEVGIDGIYWSWRGELQYLIGLNKKGDFVLATRTTFQLTPDKLLPIEQFTMGGRESVKGYRPNLEVGDIGVFSTIELRIPLTKEENWGKISLIPFFDWGIIGNNDREITGTTNFFASVGLGLRYQLKDDWEIRLDYAFPLSKAEGFGETNTEQRFTFYLLSNPF